MTDKIVRKGRCEMTTGFVVAYDEGRVRACGEEEGMNSPFFAIVKYRRTNYQYKGLWSEGSWNSLVNAHAIEIRACSATVG